MSERIEVEGNLPGWNYTDMTIFNTQPTCGELSCDQCNERYAKVVDRIKALEDVVRELLMFRCTGCYLTERHPDCGLCNAQAKALELVNGGK